MFKFFKRLKARRSALKNFDNLPYFRQQEVLHGWVAGDTPRGPGTEISPWEMASDYRK